MGLKKGTVEMLTGKQGLYFSFEGVDTKRYWTPSTLLNPIENQCNLALCCSAPTQAGYIDSCSFTRWYSWEDWEE